MKVVYLTGAPASGKSSTTRLLNGAISNLLVWEYGACLTEHLNKRLARVTRQEDIRTKSATIVTPQDIEEVDQKLIDYVTKFRTQHNIIIDSHPVTKEAFGFRITPFSFGQFQRLAPDEIWLMYASPQETIRRIAIDPAGRPIITEEEARLHTSLQASIAATYAVAIGRPMYLFDTSADRATLIDRLRARLQ